jgi:hypothetical protein
LRQPGPGWAAAYVLATVAGIYCEYSMFLLWPAAAVALPALTRWPRERTAAAWLGLQLAVLVGIVPLSRFFAAHLPIFASPEFLQMRFGALTPLLELFVVVGAAGAGVAGVLARRWGRAHPAAADRLLRVAGVVLLLGAVGLMLVPGGMTVKRVLLITAPLLCLEGASALAPRPAGRAEANMLPANESGAINRAATDQGAREATPGGGGGAGRGLLAVLAVSVVAVAIMFATVPKEPWREVVAAVQAAAQPGDVVLLAPAWTMVPFDYYATGHLPRLGVTPTDLPALAARLAPYRRAWLILGEDRVIDPDGQVPRWIASHYPHQRTQAYYQIQVELFTLPGP